MQPTRHSFKNGLSQQVYFNSYKIEWNEIIRFE